MNQENQNLQRIKLRTNESKEDKLNKIMKFKLTNDYLFKRIFTSEDNKPILKDLIEAVLDTKIRNIEIKNPEILKDRKDQKMGVLDVKAHLDNEEVVDVEMQVNNNYNIEKRSAIYLSKLVAGQLKAGEDYSKLKKTIVINIMQFNYFNRNTYHSVAHMKFEDIKELEFVDAGFIEEQRLVTDALEMHFIELPKYKKKNPKCDTKLEQWLWTLLGESEEKIKMAEEKNPEIKKEVEIRNKLSLEEKERELYESREKELMDIRVTNNHAREEGREEGKAIGESNRNIEIAKAML